MHPIVDAFWQGRNKFKKNRGNYFDNYKKPKLACHVGAVYYGTFKDSKMEMTELNIMWPELHNMVPVPCEDTQEKEGWIVSILIHLNDAHDAKSWPDQRVADWLEEALKSGTALA